MDAESQRIRAEAVAQQAAEAVRLLVLEMLCTGTIGRVETGVNGRMCSVATPVIVLTMRELPDRAA